MDWHTLTTEETLRETASSPEGLSTPEAEARLAASGPNALPEPGRLSPGRLFLAQFTDLLIVVLLGAAAVSAALGEIVDAAVILAIVLLNAVVGFVQEFRAERTMEALRDLAAPAARLLRDGTAVSLPAADVVVGDLVLLEAGGIVPADLRVVEGAALLLDESLLTGESAAVEKSAEKLSLDDVPLADRRNMAYRGTMVAGGRGRGVVVATGAATELGRIASLLGRTGETRTPLQRRLAAFSRRLAVAIVVICIVVFAAGVLRGEPTLLMFLTAVSLAVAAIPEALPAAVTVALALGAARLATRNALVRRLPAVEALGSVTVICADKTGTLTENRMRVAELFPGETHTLLEAMALCGDASAAAGGGSVGEPTETALYDRSAAAGVVREEREKSLPRVAEIPFDSGRRRMTTVHRRGESLIAYTKGAPEAIFPAVTDWGETDRRDAEAEAFRMSSEGLRVIAFATRRLRTAEGISAEETERELSFLGLAGLHDPPRSGAEGAVAACRSAGIRPVMITGDHPETARAVATRLGIFREGDGLLTGADLERLTTEELRLRGETTAVYARIAPEQKLAIVRALQEEGEIAAMTGDGVNDAPALRRADIGVAMGRGGTDVAREASAMILLDDDFTTIVGAVAEGRRINDNIRKFIRYLLATNSGEVLTLFLAPFLGLPLPLLPAQILWINLMTDALPALALAAEPAEKEVMARPPRPPAEGILAGGVGIGAGAIGLLIALLCLGAEWWGLGAGKSHWQSIVFTVLCFTQLFNALAVRSERRSLAAVGLFTNPAMTAAIAASVLLQLAALYLPVLNVALRTEPLTAMELAASAAVSSLVLAAAEGVKWVRRRKR